MLLKSILSCSSMPTVLLSVWTYPPPNRALVAKMQEDSTLPLFDDSSPFAPQKHFQRTLPIPS